MGKGRTRPFCRDHSSHLPQGANCVGRNRLATVPRRPQGLAREFVGDGAGEDPCLQGSHGRPCILIDPEGDVQPRAPLVQGAIGPGTTRVGLEAAPGTIWKVRMLSVRRPGNAGDTTSPVATESQEPRLDTDRVAPNANGADRGRPSRSGARGQEETDSEDTDDSEHHTQELRAYSDDGAESELGEPEGHGRSRPDAASRGESRQLVPEVGLHQRLERGPSLERPRSVMSLDGLETYTHRTQRVTGPYDGGVGQLEIRSRPWSLDCERRVGLVDHHKQTFGEMADGGLSAAAPEAGYLCPVSGRPAATDEDDEGHRLEIHTRELEHGIQMGWIEDSRPHHPLNRVIREDWRFPGVVGLAPVQPAREPRNQDGSGRQSEECPRRTDDGGSWFLPPAAASEEQRGYQYGRPSVMKYGPDVLAMRTGGRREEYPGQHWAEPKRHPPAVVSASTSHGDDGHRRCCYGDADPTAWQTEEKRCWDREEVIRPGDVQSPSQSNESASGSVPTRRWT